MADVSVVVPSIKDEVVTLESVPDDVPAAVERDGTLNEARNRGVREADTDVVAVMDDDIRFTESTFWHLVDMADPERLVGLADWNYGLVAGRVMVFYRETWADVGGFDERLRSHMGDTDFALKFLEHGYDVERIPREVFDHEDHERSIGKWDHAWRGLYLAFKHPRYGPRLFAGMVREAL